jgi:hypothetical protein
VRVTSEIAYLSGRTISAQVVATDRGKVRLVLQCPERTNLSKLRIFLGLTGYFRHYVEGFAKVASPFTQLMKKGQQFKRTPEYPSAFGALHRELANLPIFVMPNDRNKFVLDTDATDQAIGAVLSQVHDGHGKVAAHAGRCLNCAEANYCITRKELQTVVNCLRYFRH